MILNDDVTAVVYQVFAPWDKIMEPGVIKRLYKNGQATIEWSDGTKASRVDQDKIDGSKPEQAVAAAAAAAAAAATEADGKSA